MTTYEPPEEPEAERVAIEAFLRAMFQDVGLVVGLRENLYPRGLVPDAFHEHLPAAWEEVLETRQSVIREAREVHFDELRRAGLHGAQLELKLAIWRSARAAAASELDESDESADIEPWVVPDDDADDEVRRFDVGLPLPPKIPKYLKPFLRLLHRLLDYGDTILKSLKKAIPGGEAIEEIKEILEKLSGDVADALPDGEGTQET